MAGINLSKAVRSNLLSLQSTAAAMAKTQERLATGLKVNSALDNPSNFFTASALKSRASDMSNLLDAMSNGIKTLEAADNGLKAITKTVESMQSTLRQARQDKSFQGVSFSDTSPENFGLSAFGLSGGSLGTSVQVDLWEAKGTATGNAAYSPVDVSGANTMGFTVTVGSTTNAVSIASTNATTLSVDVDGHATTFTVGNTANVSADEMKNALNAAFTAAGAKLSASVDAGNLSISSSDYDPVAQSAVTIGNQIDSGTADVADLGLTATTASAVYQRKSTDKLVAEINGNSTLSSAVRASNDNGKLRIENLSSEELSVDGSTNGVFDAGLGSTKIAGNSVRANLVEQFNALRDQLDKFSDDASFNGINLLRGDKLKLTFNETGSSTIDIQAKDSAGVASSISTQTLGIDEALSGDLDSDTAIDARLEVLKTALGTLRSQSSAFGSNLSIVENRTDFTKAMINTLETGAAELTLADSNEEAANLLALQTRQQLSSTALSMASQADQAVLRLFS
jgi:flagellin-like hook-associated protein FlgL